MRKFRWLLIAFVTLVWGGVLAQNQTTAPPTTVPASINFIWKDVEHDFISLAEAMPEEKWSFRPTHGRSHVAE